MEQRLTDARNPAPAPGQPRPAQLKALTSIRFLAALHVALYHLVRPIDLWGPLAGFMRAGYTGVSFFFLLSGFILTYSHAGEKELGPRFRKRFYFARFARIYPVYLVALIAAVYVYRDQLAKPVHFIALFADVLMMQTWSIRMVSFFNVPAWSVSSEVFFYLVFPWVFVKLRPSSARKAVLGVALFWGLAMLAPLFALMFYPGDPWHEGFGLVNFWVRRLPLFALPEFLAGVSLAWMFVLYRSGKRHAVGMIGGAAVGLGVSLFFADHVPVVFLHNGILIPLYAMLLLGLCHDTVISRVLSWPPFLLLGEASYAFYLIHFLMSAWISGALGMDTGMRSGAIRLAIILPVAIGLHLLVERPCRRGLLRWWNGRHSSQPGGGSGGGIEARLAR